jgi:hypothetical protein
MLNEFSILIAIIGCFVGLAGWLKSRDSKIANDAEWKGGVNAKLDTIHNDVGGVCTDVRALRGEFAEHGERLTAVEASAKQATSALIASKAGKAGMIHEKSLQKELIPRRRSRLPWRNRPYLTDTILQFGISLPMCCRSTRSG